MNYAHFLANSYLKNGTMSIYRPLGIVTSKSISGKDLQNMSLNNETQEIKIVDESDEFFKEIFSQMQTTDKKDDSHLKINNFFNKGKLLNSEYRLLKKRFEADTRIFQNSLKRPEISKIDKNENEEENQLKMSLSDKYLSVDNTVNTCIQKNNENFEKECPLYKQMGVISGQIVTKMKNKSNCNDVEHSGVEKEDSLNKNWVRDKIQNGLLYSFTHSAPISNKKNNKKSFIEEFNEMKKKHGIITKAEIKKQEENLRLCDKIIKDGNSSNFSRPETQKEVPINSKIITPFRGCKTNFFSEVKPEKTVMSRKRSNKNQNREQNLTAEWVKGDVIKRRRNSHKVENSNQSPISERNHSYNNLNQSPISLRRHSYCNSFILSNCSQSSSYRKEIKSEVSTKIHRREFFGYTPLPEDGASLNDNLFQSRCISTVTTFNSVKYSSRKHYN